MYDQEWYPSAYLREQSSQHELSLLNNAAHPATRSSASHLDSQRDAQSIDEDLTGTDSMPEFADKLSMECILSNGTSSPLSLQELYKFIVRERAPENIEFYLWFQGYKAGRITVFPNLPAEESVTVPEATKLVVCPFDDPAGRAVGVVRLEDSDEFKLIEKILSPLHEEYRTHTVTFRPIPCVPSWSVQRHIINIKEAKAAGMIDEQIEELRRSEINIIKRLFISPMGAKSLNITSRLRKEALAAIELSTAADNLQEISDYVLKTMKNSHHRAFINHGTGNGTRATVKLGFGLGLLLLLCGIATILMLALLHPGAHTRLRCWVFFAFPLLAGGLFFMVAALCGTHFVLVGFNVPHPVRPDEEGGVGRRWSLSSLLTATVPRRVIPDQKLRTRNPQLLAMQKKVLRESLGVGLVVAAVLTAVILFVPIWKGV